MGKFVSIKASRSNASPSSSERPPVAAHDRRLSCGSHVHRRSQNSREGRRRRQRLPGVPPGEVRPARRSQRRRRRPRRRRHPGRHRAPQHPAPVPLQPRAQGRARPPRRRQQPHRRRRRIASRSQVPVGTVVYDEATGERLLRFHRAGRALPGGARRARRTRQRALRHLHPPGAHRARARPARAKRSGCGWS